MRTIVKRREPTSLTEHRLRPHSDYDNYPDKEALRDALVSEQRGLCCYCMGGIRKDKMKVEHWRSQRRCRTQQLNYRNLLAACRGGEGEPRAQQHCDTRKGNDDLKWNPGDPSHSVETRIRYELDGAIRSDDSEFDAQLCQVLNLNHPMLKSVRQGVLDAVLEWWRSRSPVPRARLERERNRQAPGKGELQPYCQVAVWWLDQRLKRTA